MTAPTERAFCRTSEEAFKVDGRWHDALHGPYRPRGRLRLRDVVLAVLIGIALGFAWAYFLTPDDAPPAAAQLP